MHVKLHGIKRKVYVCETSYTRLIYAPVIFHKEGVEPPFVFGNRSCFTIQTDNEVISTMKFLVVSNNQTFDHHAL